MVNKKIILVLVLSVISCIFLTLSVSATIYNISSSPLSWNGTDYYDLPSSTAKGMVFVTGGGSAVHFITADNTTIDSATNGTVSGYFHVGLINSSSGNSTVVLSASWFNASFSEDCSGFKGVMENTNGLNGIFSGGVTCNSFEYKFLDNISSGYYNFTGFTNFSASGAVTEVNNSNFTPSTNPFLSYSPVGLFAASFLYFEYNSQGYNDSAGLGGDDAPVSYFTNPTGFPEFVLADNENVSVINGSLNVHVALLNLTGGLAPGFTFFTTDEVATNCSDITTALEFSTDQCDLFISDFFIANGYDVSYTYNITALDGTNVSLGSGLTSPPTLGSVFGVSLPSRPSLNSPDNGSAIASSGSVNLNWSNSTDPDGDAITYIVELSTNISFSSFAYANTSVTETTNVTGVTVPSLSAGTYYWRVRANDGVYNSSYYSTIRSFTLSITPSNDSSNDGNSNRGGGGGGGGGSVGISIDADLQKVSSANVYAYQGYVKHIILSNGENHTITFSEVKPNSVTLKIQSEPKIITLNTGESGSVDVNNDGINDIKITLTSIEGTLASISVESLTAAPVVKPTTDVKPEDDANMPEAVPSEPSNEVMPEPSSSSGSGKTFVVVAIIIILIIVGAAAFFMRKR